LQDLEGGSPDDCPHLAYRDRPRTRRRLPQVCAFKVAANVSQTARLRRCALCRNETQRAVITLWRDLTAVDALDDSPTYKATTEEIEATGFLRGQSTVEVLELEGVVLDPKALSQEIGCGRSLQ